MENTGEIKRNCPKPSCQLSSQQKMINILYFFYKGFASPGVMETCSVRNGFCLGNESSLQDGLVSSVHTTNKLWISFIFFFVTFLTEDPITLNLGRQI